MFVQYPVFSDVVVQRQLSSSDVFSRIPQSYSQSASVM